MLRIIKEYQNQYIELLKDFIKKENKSIEEYYLFFDKIELLYKRNKKTIINYIENNKDFAFYGGATYFNQKRQEIYPIILSNKKLVAADPILKLSKFLRIPKHIDEKRIKEIIDNAIEHTIEIEKELQECYIIYLNPEEFLFEVKAEIQKTAEDLTLKYLNENLNINFENLESMEKEYREYNYKLLDEKFPNLNELIQTVNSEKDDSLEKKIYKNFFYSGMKVDELSDIQKIIMTLIGLFGQAFELKYISLYLNVPLYINRANVLLYINFIKKINIEDENNIFETNILFSLYIFFRDYKFIDDYEKIDKYSKENNIYINIIKNCSREELSINSYLNIIENIFKDSENIESIMSKL